MYELSRVRLFSIGPPGARYQDVCLDLRGVGDPISAPVQTDLFAPDDPSRLPRRPAPASVLFLENGGGKSVLIKLIFSVMLPGRRQVVGTTNTRVLEKFVLADDVAHVVCEWMHTGTGERLLTGKVSEWRGHVVSTDSAKLADAWYSLRPTDDVHLDSLPMQVDGRRVTMSRYAERLRTAYQENPELALTWETGHRDWTEHLVELGLDPELFRYQRAMNAGEGEAAEAFSFRTDESFVDFLLRAVLDEEDPRGLAEVLDGYATTLAQRADLTAEREFVAESVELLGPLSDAHRDVEAARATEAARRRDAARLAGSLRARQATEAGRIDAAREHADAVADAAGRADAEQRRLQEVAGELARLTAELRLRAAKVERDALAEQRADAEHTARAWQGTGAVLRARQAAAELARLDEVLAGQQERARPARLARARAAAAFAAGLSAMAGDADQAAVDAGERADSALAGAAEQRAIEAEWIRAAAGHRTRAERAAADVDGVRSRVRAAASAGVLPVDTDPTAVAAAASAAERERVDAAAALAAAHDEQEDLRRRRVEGDAESHAAQEAATAARAAVAEAERAVADAVQGRDALAAEIRLAELMGTESVRPESDAEALVGLLGAAVTSAEHDRGEVQLAQQRDRRALHALGSGGLLPEPAEVEDALAALESAGITAHSGWRYLAGLPAERRPIVLETLPHLVSGVLLNDIADLPRAREVLTAATLLPGAVISVSSTAAMHGDERVPGEYFVVTPNPAMYDEDAAERTRAELITATEQRTARLAELTERAREDRALTDRVRWWRARYPRGRTGELEQALERARGAAELAGFRAGRLAEQRAAADARAEELAVSLPGLRDAEQASRTRAQSLAVLAAETTGLTELADVVRIARAAADEADTGAGQAAAQAQAQQARADELRRSQDRHAAVARTCRDELAGLPEPDPEAPVEQPDDAPSEPVEVLRSEFRRADADYAAVGVGADLQARMAAAQAQAQQARVALAELDEAVRDRAGVLLGTPDAADAASRAAATEQATRVQIALAEQLGESRAAVGRAEQAVLAHPRQNRGVEPYGRPRDVEHGAELLATVERDVAEAATRAATALVEQEHAQAEHTRVAASAQRLGALVDGLDVSGDDTDGEPAPFDGDVDAAVTRWRTERDALREATRVRGEAERTVQEAVDAVAQHAQQTRFDAVASPVRRHVLAVRRSEMPALAQQWADALLPRLRSLTDDLAHIDRHRGGLVARLQGMVGGALRTLRLAQRLSTLPDGLGDWSGQEFLRVRFDDPDEATLVERLGEVVDQAAADAARAGTGKGAADQRDGMSLVLRGVRAAMPRGVRVEMLKPDAVLRTERLRVSEIKDVFSGGQQLTAAIILYCTMAALRANDRGEGRRRHSGVLFLDNPIGRASAGYLLDLQLGVAKALGVQLAYTTGLFDAGALSVFPLIVRLRNDADLRAGRKYLSVDDEIRRVIDALPEPDGTAGLSAVRLFRRPGPDADEQSRTSPEALTGSVPSR